VIPYTTTRDLSHAIEALRHLTTDFEQEDELNIYIEPLDLMGILELIFFKLKTCYSDAETLFPIQSDLPEIPAAQITALAFFTKELLHRHGKKITKKGELFL
jgi:hypothetical protein